ncbi:hypothetical protein PVAG01_11178 [Phlyctema vagabunda]|uniref:F-box protein n=1 Tax=Phlyctema vagabunda TaxID=108571 RepID=A0ABR4P1K4_9HELO
MEDLTITTEFCALCRRPFPTQVLEGFDGWQSFGRADVNREESIELTNVFQLPNVNDDLEVPLPEHLRTVTISRDQRSRQPGVERTAFCFHEWCYLFLTRRLAVCSRSVIFRLARALTPDPTVWEEVCERYRDLDSIGVVQVQAGSNSSLLSSLPLELRIHIWQYTRLKSRYGAFLMGNETSRLARSLRHPLHCQLALKRGSRISAEMISVFGTDYIQVLNIDCDCKGNILGDTTEVTYVSSLGGICAIRLYGADWRSDWIGKIPITSCIWYGRIRGEVPTLICGYNVGW